MTYFLSEFTMYLITWHNAKSTVIVIEEERLDLLTYFVAGTVHPVAANPVCTLHTHTALPLYAWALSSSFLQICSPLCESSTLPMSFRFSLFAEVEGGNSCSRLRPSSYWPKAVLNLVRFWTKVQLIRLLKGRTRDDFDFDILDATQVWPEELVPVQPIGE